MSLRWYQRSIYLVKPIQHLWENLLVKPVPELTPEYEAKVTRCPEKRPVLPDHPMYRAYRFRFEGLKILLQMMLGVLIVLVVILRLSNRLTGWPSVHIAGLTLKWAFDLPILDLVGYALAYSSAIELAYTLFTPGPDEAIEPVLMALAAAAILTFSKITHLDVFQGLAAILFVVAIAGLFAVTKYLIKS